MSTIFDKQKWDRDGARNREVWLQDVETESQREPTLMLVRESYGLLIERVLGDSPYVLITINLDMTAMGRALDVQSRIAGKKSAAQYLMLGREYYEARRAGETYQDAMESLLAKFLCRFNKKVLGTHRYIRCKQSLRWIRVYENAGKRFAGGPVNHMHMLLEIPPSLSYQQFEQAFRQLFSWLIYPLDLASTHDAVLDIQHGRLDGVSPHPEYIQKQLINWQAAANRISFSAISEVPLRRESSNEK
jgi:REP element-mobilizing transposase RayT